MPCGGTVCTHPGYKAYIKTWTTHSFIKNLDIKLLFRPWWQVYCSTLFDLWSWCGVCFIILYQSVFYILGARLDRNQWITQKQFRITTLSMYDSITCSLCFLAHLFLVFVEHIFVIRVFQQINKKAWLYYISLHKLLWFSHYISY